MRDMVLDLLRAKNGEFVSGQDMSNTCHVSRTAIWKHIKALRDKGYVIESFTKKGYRLIEEPDLLRPSDVQKDLHTKYFGQHYIYMDSTDSSNREAKLLAQEGAPEGTIVVAETQSAGRGRLTRGWFSPYGKGIWMSLILRPKFSPIEAPKCTLMAAVALTKAFHALGLETAGIKWPNDILVKGKKIVGILTEMSGTMEEISYIIMGMGINISVGKSELPEDIKDIATSFAMEGVTVDRKVALQTILQELENQYNKVVSGGFDTTLEEWKQLSVTLHQDVEVRAPGNTYVGHAIDIDRDGNLIVRLPNGKTERIIAGDVSIRPAMK